MSKKTSAPPKFSLTVIYGVRHRKLEFMIYLKAAGIAGRCPVRNCDFSVYSDALITISDIILIGKMHVFLKAAFCGRCYG